MDACSLVGVSTADLFEVPYLDHLRRAADRVLAMRNAKGTLFPVSGIALGCEPECVGLLGAAQREEGRFMAFFTALASMVNEKLPHFLVTSEWVIAHRVNEDSDWVYPKVGTFLGPLSFQPC